MLHSTPPDCDCTWGSRAWMRCAQTLGSPTASYVRHTSIATPTDATAPALAPPQTAARPFVEAWRESSMGVSRLHSSKALQGLRQASSALRGLRNTVPPLLLAPATRLLVQLPQMRVSTLKHGGNHATSTTVTESTEPQLLHSPGRQHCSSQTALCMVPLGRRTWATHPPTACGNTEDRQMEAIFSPSRPSQSFLLCQSINNSTSKRLISALCHSHPGCRQQIKPP